MNLLGSILYDPAGAVSKATSALLAMTAFDTTNLRQTITVPAHGFVYVRMMASLEGATTFPQVMLGVMVGAAIVGRVTPVVTINGTALATTRATILAEFVIPGLAAGSTVFDAAYAVEIVVAATNIKYGGPNDTTTDNAWGAFVFEIWDPRPLPTAANGAIGGLLTAPTTANIGTVDVLRWNGTVVSAPATAGIPEVNVKNINNVTAAAVTTINANIGMTQPINFTGAGAAATVKSDVVNIAGAAVNTAAAQIGTNVVSYAAGQAPLQPTVAGRTLDVTATGAAGIDWGNLENPTTANNLSNTQILNAASIVGAVGSVIGNVGGNVVGNIGGNIIGTVSAVVGNVGGNVVGSVGSVSGLNAAFIDVAISSRLATAGYTAPDNAGIATNGAGIAAIVNIVVSPMPESYAALHVVPTMAEILYEMRAILAENNVTGVTVTTRQIDGITPAHTYTINNAVTPTDLTTTT